MIFVFDLDDTLYDELTYVQSGFASVAHFVGETFGIPEDKLLTEFLDCLRRDGRGAVFDSVLTRYGIAREGLVGECVGVYRSHVPRLEPFPAARRMLDALAERPLYLVTDGYPMAQQTKILALGLDRRFAATFATSAFGPEYEKPSTRCFEMLAAMAGEPIESLCYVGDNPAKDFVGLNRLGASTVRVLTGQHAQVVAAEGYDAQYVIEDLDSLIPKVIESGVLGG